MHRAHWDCFRCDCSPLPYCVPQSGVRFHAQHIWRRPPYKYASKSLSIRIGCLIVLLDWIIFSIITCFAHFHFSGDFWYFRFLHITSRTLFSYINFSLALFTMKVRKWMLWRRTMTETIESEVTLPVSEVDNVDPLCRLASTGFGRVNGFTLITLVHLLHYLTVKNSQ